MILLSKGEDNYNYNRVVSMFEDLIIKEGKEDYVFTLNTSGYGYYYDYNLMNNIALTKGGNYFNIDKLTDVNDTFLKIYGSLSTVSNVNVQLKIQSKYNIIIVYGIEDMNDGNITSDTLSSFNVKLIQVVYDKKYDFTLLVDVPKNTSYETEVLNATVSSLGLNAKYLWDEKYNINQYNKEDITFDKVILSIYSSNKDHIAGSNITNSSQHLKIKLIMKNIMKLKKLKELLKAILFF